MERWTGSALRRAETERPKARPAAETTRPRASRDQPLMAPPRKRSIARSGSFRLASPPLATTSDEMTDDRFMAGRFPRWRSGESLRKIGLLRAGRRRKAFW